MNNLKNCPCCGGQAIMQAPNMHKKTAVTCKSCGLSTKWGMAENDDEPVERCKECEKHYMYGIE